MAALLYGDLSDRDAAALRAYFETHADARAEFEALQSLRNTIPTTTPTLDIDLAPMLRQRLADEAMQPSKTRAGSRRAGVYAVAAAALVGIIVYGNLQSEYSTQQGPVGASIGGQSAIDPDLAKAEELIRARAYADAYQTLKSAVEANPTDAKAAMAQLRLADIAYDELHAYSDARDQYTKLMRDYVGAVQDMDAQLRVAERRDVLEEASRVNYASLQQLDLAQDDFARMANVVEQYPGSLVASLAADAMARKVQRDAGASGQTDDGLIQAMEAAKAQCDNPVVVAQLNLELGSLHSRAGANAALARGLLEQARDAGNAAIAERAELALAQLQ